MRKKVFVWKKLFVWKKYFKKFFGKKFFHLLGLKVHAPNSPGAKLAAPNHPYLNVVDPTNDAKAVNFMVASSVSSIIDVCPNFLETIEPKALIRHLCALILYQLCVKVYQMSYFY